MRPDRPKTAGAPAQLELAWATASDRKRIKALKRLVARAKRIEREGPGPLDVTCPQLR
jgi:hypothetical protein